MNDSPIYTVGVDLGGTNTQIAVVEKSGKIISRIKFSTKEYPEITEYAERLSTEILSKIETIGGKAYVKGIGIGAPCVNTRLHCIDNAADLPWKGRVPLPEMIETRTGLPVEIANDANSAAVGEMTYGCAQGMTDFIVLTLGTGMGSGIVVDGHVINGKRGFAGELGHVTFPFAKDRLCGCGRYGCLETVCAASGLVTTALKLLREDKTESLLRSIEPHLLTSYDISMAAKSGDSISRKVFHITEEALGRACAEFAAMTDPEAIILFGGVADRESMNPEHIREVMEEYMLYVFRGDVKILFSALHGADAAILGAASLPWQKI